MKKDGNPPSYQVPYTVLTHPWLELFTISLFVLVLRAARGEFLEALEDLALDVVRGHDLRSSGRTAS